MLLELNSIENLIGLQELKVISMNENNGKIEVYAKSKYDLAVCPKCKKETNKIHDFRFQEYEHLYIWGNVTIIHLTIRRFVCICDISSPFDEEFSFIRKYQRQTIAFENYIFQLCNKNTILNVAEFLNISDNKVQRIFNHYAKLKIDTKENSPLIFLGIDDIAKSKGYVYYTVLYNHETGDVVALIDGRTKETVISYIKKNFTNEQRNGVLAVSLDMSKTYASAILECFPNAAPVVDRFHISQALHNCADNARKHIQNKIRKEENDTKKVFKIRWSFLKNTEDLHADEIEKLNKVLNEYPKLSLCYELKEEFREFFNITNLSKASAFIDYYTIKVAESGIKELESFCKTLNNWKDYILNYYYYFITHFSKLKSRVKEISLAL